MRHIRLERSEGQNDNGRFMILCLPGASGLRKVQRIRPRV